MTEVTEPQMIPPGELSPLDKARLPRTLQFAAVMTFVAGLLPVAVALAHIIVAVGRIVFAIVTGQPPTIDIPVSRPFAMTVAAGVVAMLAGRGLLRLEKAWRAAVLGAVWLAMLCVPVLVYWACHSYLLALKHVKPFGRSDMSLSDVPRPLLGPAAIFAFGSIVLLLLTSRSATEAFGRAHSPGRRVVILVSLLISLAVCAIIAAAVLGPHIVSAEALAT